MKKGERYKIWNRTLADELVVEGLATLLTHVSTRRKGEIETWAVNFDEDSKFSTYDRVVHKEDKVS